MPSNDGCNLRKPHILKHRIHQSRLYTVNIRVFHTVHRVDSEKSFVQVVVREGRHVLPTERRLPNIEVRAFYMSLEIAGLWVELLMRIMVFPPSVLFLFRVVRTNICREFRGGFPRLINPRHDISAKCSCAFMVGLIQPSG